MCIENEENGEAAKGKWKSALVKCKLCDHEHVVVYPMNCSEEDNLECDNCGHMSCVPIEIINTNKGKCITKVGTVWEKQYKIKGDEYINIISAAADKLLVLLEECGGDSIIIEGNPSEIIVKRGK